MRLFTRNGYDFTARFPKIAAAVAGLPARSCVVDGEAIVVNRQGLPAPASYSVPDGPREQAPEGLDPRDLRGYPVRKRLGLLEPLLAVVVPPAERGYAPLALECTELEGLKRQRPDRLHGGRALPALK